MSRTYYSGPGRKTKAAPPPLHKRFTLAARPTVTPDGDPIPADAAIYNAARPLAGTLTWAGDSIRGIFYAAVTPGDPLAPEKLAVNRSQAAAEIVYVTEAEVAEATIAYFRKEFSEVIDPSMGPQVWDYAVGLFLEECNAAGRWLMRATCPGCGGDGTDLDAFNEVMGCGLCDGTGLVDPTALPAEWRERA